MQMGFRINSEVGHTGRLTPEEFKGISTCNIADVMGRFHVMDPNIRPVDIEMSFAGRAITVMCRPGDNLMVHKALEVAKPGDILVVNTVGNTTSAVFGELMCRSAMKAKLGGIVVDGAIRDVLALRELNFPAFSRTICAGGCDKDGPGEINFPIACGGVVVNPGDIVVGDADGIVVIRQDEEVQVLEKVKKHMEKEKKRIAEIEEGIVFKGEINEILASKGVI